MKDGRSGVVAGGNWIVDTVKVIDVFPEQDALANILGQTSCNGGGAYNLLVDLAMMKAPFPLWGIGLIGNDAAGDGILAHCASLGIDASQLHRTDKGATSYTDVMAVRSTGRRTFFHQRGANALLDIEHFDFSRVTAKIFHFGYLLLLDRLDSPFESGTRACEVLRSAKAAGLLTSIDAVSEDSDRFRSVVIPALPFADICFMNEFEASRTTGVVLRQDGEIGWDALPAAGRFLLDHGVREWAIIHFPEGAFALSVSGQQLSLPSPKIEKIASAVGAGDAFAAGVLYGFHEGREMNECIEFGFAAAAACLSDNTTSGGIRPLRVRS